ncbi:IS66-like element accessory protein TnpA [Vineibacter terrae]|uniref:IS66-like element accessory protein TnpA n=1 Tax=Vineibacter terrae TaxID=2586908 RepID=UPI0015B68553|nr:transposase [Vineibacter terrae]
MTTVTVLSGPERRRRWPASEKARIVAESLQPGAVVSEVARRNDVHENLLHGWRRQARMVPSPGAVGRGAGFVPLKIASDEREAAMGGATATAIEVSLGNGIVLRVPQGAAVGRVAQLATALAGHGR